MNENDKKWWEAFRESASNTLTNEEVEKISELHAEYFLHKYHRPCGCNPRKIQSWINELNELYLGN